MTAIALALSSALLHFVWQGMLVSFLLWTALLFLRKRSANVAERQAPPPVPRRRAPWRPPPDKKNGPVKEREGARQIAPLSRSGT
jgi:hypothetical protein